MGLRHLAIFSILPIVILQIFRRPHFGVYVFTALTLVRIHELMWGFQSLRLLLVISVVTLVAYALKAGEYEGPRLGESPPLLLLTAFLALIVLSACFAVGRPDGVTIAFERVGKYAKMFLFLLLMQKMLDDWEKVDTFLLVWILGASFLALWGIQQHFLGNDRLERVGGGDTNGSNELGALFVLLLPFILQRGLVEEARLRRWVYYGLVPVFIVAIAYTGSRSAFLGLIVAGLVLFVRTQQRAKLVKLSLPLVPLLIPLSIYYFSERVETIETYRQDWSAVSRLYFWKAAVNMAAAHPAMGVGPANYPLVCAQYGSPEVGRDCHSTWFTMISEVGVPTFAIWVAALGAAILGFERLRKAEGDHPERVKIRATAIGLEAGFVAFLVDGSLNTFGHFEYLYWPIILGVCLKHILEKVPEGAEVATAEVELARAPA